MTNIRLFVRVETAVPSQPPQGALSCPAGNSPCPPEGSLSSQIPQAVIRPLTRVSGTNKLRQPVTKPQAVIRPLTSWDYDNKDLTLKLQNRKR